MSPADIIDAITFVVGNLAAILIASALSIRAVPDRSRLALRVAAGAAIFILVTSLVTLLFGILGLLEAHVIAGILVIPAIAAALQLRRERGRDRDCDRRVLLLNPRPLRDWSPLLPVAAGLGAWWLVRNLALGSWITNDDNTYHAAILVDWLKSGEIGIPATTYQAYFPLNGELLALWFLLPFGHDGAVPLAGMVYLTLFLSLSIHYAEVLGASQRWQLLPAVLVLASTPILFGLTTFTDLDFSPPVVLLAAIGFLLASLENADRHRLRHPFLNWPLILLGGACAGFVVGMKVSFAPPTAVICALFAAAVWRRIGLPRAVLASGLVTVAALGAGAYWYFRNWLLTGNPLYPAALGSFEGPFGSADQHATKLASVVAAGLDSSQWKLLLDGFFYRPWTVTVILLAGLLVGGILILRRRSLDSDQRLAVLALLACTGIILAAFPLTPFSGTNEVGGLEVTGRYLNFLYLAGGCLAVLMTWRAPELSTLPRRLAVLVLSMLAFTLPFVLHTDKAVGLAIVGITLLSFAAIEIMPLLPGVRIPGIRIRTLIFVLPLAALATVPLNLRSTDTALASNPLVGQIEDLPAKSRIALFNGWLHQGYLLSGRRLQHDAVRLLGDGQRYLPFHERGRTVVRGENEDFWTYERHHGETGLDAASLVKNLQSADIDFLITSPHPNGGWPEQHHLLQAEAAFPKFSESERGVVWDLRQPEPEQKQENDNISSGAVVTPNQPLTELSP